MKRKIQANLKSKKIVKHKKNEPNNRIIEGEEISNKIILLTEQYLKTKEKNLLNQINELTYVIFTKHTEQREKISKYFITIAEKNNEFKDLFSPLVNFYINIISVWDFAKSKKEYYLDKLKRLHKKIYSTHILFEDEFHQVLAKVLMPYEDLPEHKSILTKKDLENKFMWYSGFFDVITEPNYFPNKIYDEEIFDYIDEMRNKHRYKVKEAIVKAIEHFNIKDINKLDSIYQQYYAYKKDKKSKVNFI